MRQPPDDANRFPDANGGFDASGGLEAAWAWFVALDTPWRLVLLLALALCVALVGWRRTATRSSRASRGRQRVAARGEGRAEALAEAAGFTVLDRQVSQRWWIQVDGEHREVLSRVDLLLERDGLLYVADVKTGQQAPDPTFPATRRQLLEYILAFDADGALILDMQSQAVREVELGLVERHVEH